MEYGKIFLYTDETALCFEGFNWQEVYGTAERGLKNCKPCFDQNGLTINVKKTKCMAVVLWTGRDPDNLTLGFTLVVEWLAVERLSFDGGKFRDMKRGREGGDRAREREREREMLVTCDVSV
ncbi:hypothetical protein J6590_092219 [Homalodisca vitripennis]|nr:hypothetical protein J6590_092219 [Homalodisca vitripennis]